MLAIITKTKFNTLKENKIKSLVEINIKNYSRHSLHHRKNNTRSATK